jgi:hypothetical protein
MPTNPLWTEHTEKAAWETVGALREQVEQERARSDRLTRLEPTLPRIVELLDQAREALGLETEAPATLLATLLERLETLRQERDALRADLAARDVPPPQASRPETAPAPPTRPSQKASPLRWFASQLERRRREIEIDADLAPSGGGLPEVATRVEERLREIVPLPYAPSALRTVALDLGLAAFELARAARRAERAG